MQRNLRRATRLVGVDLVLMMAFIVLMCVGLLMVYSASIADAYTYYGTPLYVFEREILWVVVGFAALSVTVKIPYHRLQALGLPFLGVTILALVAVLTPHLGHSSHGASRWFSLGGGVAIEPSELVKLALVLYLASWLATKGDQVRGFKTCTFPFSVILGLIAILIVRQPDLGTTIVVTVTGLCVFFVAGANLRHVALIGAGASGIAWIMAHSSSYRYDRLMAFTDPWKDPTGTGYHTIQVLMALGSGGAFGRGLGNSVQKDVLPAPHTDSILAVIGEEWGLIGTVGVLLLFVILAYRGLRIATSAPDNFGRLLAAGITSWITFQALMNFAVITSSVPFTGVPLPFISYGGTSLIISMAAMGILLNISRHSAGEAVAHRGSDHRRGDGRTRVPRVIDHPAPQPVRALAVAGGSQSDRGRRGRDTTGALDQARGQRPRGRNPGPR
jgi:cell division protein FtsW